jgi:putative acetyltransferase
VGAQPVMREEPQPISPVSVRLFQSGDEADFWRLNEAWISKYFALEPKDVETLKSPQRKIIDPGGQVFLAFLDGVAVGCIALINMGDCSYEVAKMATDENYQRRGIARTMMNAAIEWARKQGARRLYLETNSSLAPALALYAASGFKRIPPKATPYKRADVFMELWLEPEWISYI